MGDSSLKYTPSSVDIAYKSRQVLPIPIPQLGDTEKYSNPGDLCCVNLFCATHRRVALVELDNHKGLFLPNEQFNLGDVTIDMVLNTVIRNIVDAQNVKFRNLLIAKIDRMQLPTSETYVTRYIYRVEVANSPSVTGNVCICQLTHKVPVQWLTYAEICNQMASLAGPEPKFVFHRTTSHEDIQSVSGFKPIKADCFRECNSVDAIEQFQPELLVNKKSQIASCANFQWSNIRSLHNEFVLHCYPSTLMTQGSLARFLHCKLLVAQLSEEKMSKYFRSFDLCKRNYLNFSELLQGLAVFKAGQLACNHQTCTQIRHEYLFRYYSSSAKRDRLSMDDLCNLMLDLVDKQPSTDTLIEARHRVEAVTEKHKISLNSTGVTLKEYFALAKDEMFKSVKLHQLNLKLDSVGVAKFFRQPDQLTPTQTLPNNNSTATNKKCLGCTRTKFYQSTHFISLTEIGEVSEINKLEAETSQIAAKELKPDLGESNMHLLANDLVDRIKRFGMIVFGQDEVPPGLGVENLFFPNKATAINYLKMVSNKAEEIFASEPRVLDLTSPCYILGDIHGNLKDLLNFASNLWKTSPYLNQSKYLFLGDYVDRGSYGVECVIYLFCMKILAPNNFFFLRGNHEVRDIQERFSFWRECCTRFNDDLWDIINIAFDRLPIAATIDDKVYCAHGGIPASVNTVAQIRSIPSPLDNPVMQSLEAWEILWNDPICKSEFGSLSAFEQNTLESNGFARNVKRGTAMMYSELAVEHFLKRNQLDQIVRAHEVFDEGYRLHLLGQVLSVFSCSKYIQQNNRASVLFLDGHQIRIIQMCTD